MHILVFNPGGNSLKAEIVECDPHQRYAFEGAERVSVSVEGIGKTSRFLRYNGKSVINTEPIQADSYEAVAVFDSAFHRTIPEAAALYAIPPELSQKHHLRRYGFHGVSHRYLMERYAHLQGKPPEECTIITMHLESAAPSPRSRTAAPSTTQWA